MTVTLSPDERFPVPNSDGYSVYGALLSKLDEADAAVAERVHDAQFGSVRVGALRGRFGDADRRHHKLALPTETYTLPLAVVDPEDDAVFEALVSALVFDGDRLDLTDGTVFVEAFESERTTRESLLATASDHDDPAVTLSFRSPTCIQETDEVTTMFPHRASVFLSLAGAWRRSLPDDGRVPELELDRQAVEGNVIEKPDVRSLDTHSVLVNRVATGDGDERPIFRQGFTGTCTYEFKGASESVENAVTTLALFAEYAGVGSAVSRGCGDVTVEVTES